MLQGAEPQPKLVSVWLDGNPIMAHSHVAAMCLLAFGRQRTRVLSSTHCAPKHTTRRARVHARRRTSAREHSQLVHRARTHVALMRVHRD